MKASEIMTKTVVTVTPDTHVKEIAALMSKSRISGVPVVAADGSLIGILSESDLLHRAETGTEIKRKWWLGAFVDADSLAREYAKSHGLKAEDIMSRSVVTVSADAELGQVAELLERKKLKRVPVVSGGKLVGIITRGDLVRALAHSMSGKAATAVGDAELSKAIDKRMREVAWLNASYVNVAVTGGVAEINGLLPSADQRRALRILVEETPGVTRVVDNLRVGPMPMSA
ncbi:MAG: CBS domain-containing protein [Hyphomicrobiaceae bacterium]|nr:CBS domain-containing protein [Hyphomicrobiaceae bacterium]